jgi:hypothetical protein
MRMHISLICLHILGSPTSNIVDLKPCFGEEDELESRKTQMQEGEDDMDINTSDTSTPTQSDFWSHYSGSCAPTK